MKICFTRRERILFEELLTSLGLASLINRISEKNSIEIESVIICKEITVAQSKINSTIGAMLKERYAEKVLKYIKNNNI